MNLKCFGSQFEYMKHLIILTRSFILKFVKFLQNRFMIYKRN